MIDITCKIVDEEKVFFIGYKKIGREFEMVKWLMSNDGISSSKAHKIVNKIKVSKS